MSEKYNNQQVTVKKVELLQQIDSICPLMGSFPDGRPAFDDHKKLERWTLNPMREDKHIGSFSINLKTGDYHDFSDGSSGDILNMYMVITGKSFHEVLEEDSLNEQFSVRNSYDSSGVRSHGKIPLGVPPEGFQPILPGYPTPHTIFSYTNAVRKLVFWILRWDKPDGKDIRPAYYGIDRKMHAGLPDEVKDNRPLFQLEQMLKRPETIVLVVEGEKACVAASKLFPEYCVITWSGGAQTIMKTDFNPLYGRSVILWPDADEPGKHAMSRILRELSGKAEVKLLDIGGKLPKWDAADLLMEMEAGVADSQEVFQEMLKLEISELKTIEQHYENVQGLKNDDKKRQSQTDELLELIQSMDSIELWRNEASETFITSAVHDARGTWEIPGKKAEFLIRKIWHTRNPNRALSAETLRSLVATLETQALFGSNTHESAVRLTGDHESIYVDLGDESWDLVHITNEGWQVESGFSAPVRFYRPNGLLPFPRPVLGGSLSELKEFINVPEEESWALVAGWLLGTYSPSGPYPGLIISGPQGSAKSSLSEFLRKLIDPNVAALRRMPKKEIDIILSAKNSRLLAFDNLSGLSESLSDVFCTLSTGGGFSTRKLFTDTQESLFYFCRPWMINGIDATSSRMDLMDRSIILHLQPIPEHERKMVSDLKSLFDKRYPYILGAIFTAASVALKNFTDIELENPPRMADFFKWVIAGESQLGIPKGLFLQAYKDNRQDVLDDSVENDSFIPFLFHLLNSENPWEGTSKTLLEQQQLYLKNHDSDRRDWPKSPQGVGLRLNRIQPLLDQIGIVFYRNRSGGKRTLIIENLNKKQHQVSEEDKNIFPENILPMPDQDLTYLEGERHE